MPRLTPKIRFADRSRLPQGSRRSSRGRWEGKSAIRECMWPTCRLLVRHTPQTLHTCHCLRNDCLRIYELQLVAREACVTVVGRTTCPRCLLDAASRLSAPTSTTSSSRRSPNTMKSAGMYSHYVQLLPVGGMAQADVMSPPIERTSILNRKSDLDISTSSISTTASSAKEDMTWCQTRRPSR